MVVRFIGGGNRSTGRKPQTCRKSAFNKKISHFNTCIFRLDVLQQNKHDSHSIPV